MTTALVLRVCHWCFVIISVRCQSLAMIAAHVFRSTAAGERSLQLLCQGGPAEAEGAAWQMTSAWR